MADIPTTQKAIRVHTPGGPEVVCFDTDAPVPTISDTQILIKNQYAGVNFIDMYFRKGYYPLPLPLTLGREGAGEIVKVGSKVTEYAVGDRVAFVPYEAYCEYCVADATNAKLYKLPKEISSELAAGAILQGLTALTFVEEAHDVKKGQFILIHAAAGGTGSWFVQAAKLRGAIVIGTTSNAEKAELAKSHGADYIINYRTEDVVKRVMEITDNKGVSAVFDGIGKDTYDISFECLGRKGTFVSFGAASGPVPPVQVQSLAKKNLKLVRPLLFGYIDTQEEWKHYTKILFDHIKDGTFKVTISKVYPLEETGQALQDLESGKTTGKLVIKI